MARRTYNQYCSVARSLDLVGDRWTLLIVRELMIGPQRYTDLLEGLPGIGPNHLAERLKRLLGAGVVDRCQLPPPAASTVYELTARGRELEPVILGLARWGVELLGAADRAQAWRAEWTVVALRGRFNADAALGIDAAYQFVVDEQPFWAHVRDGELRTGLGQIEDPSVTVTATREAFTAVAAGELSLEVALAGGDYRVDGDTETLGHAAAIFGAAHLHSDAA